uniref:Uncharacterized protein n=1 Tax=Vespula pensylvanica TaxID=30213 RepID=A0A834P4K8_VESPE|nr:hypothetical protein H0235_007366 [Vespula pensylvanica]
MYSRANFPWVGGVYWAFCSVPEDYKRFPLKTNKHSKYPTKTDRVQRGCCTGALVPLLVLVLVTGTDAGAGAGTGAGAGAGYSSPSRVVRAVLFNSEI